MSLLPSPSSAKDLLSEGRERRLEPVYQQTLSAPLGFRFDHLFITQGRDVTRPGNALIYGRFTIVLEISTATDLDI